MAAGPLGSSKVVETIEHQEAPLPPLYALTPGKSTETVNPP